MLARLGEQELYTVLSVDMPAVDAGSSQLLSAYETRLAEFDPLTSDFDDLSTWFHGDSALLKLDPDGRIILSDAIRDHTGIVDQVTFVGRGDHFQLWAPPAFEERRQAARKRVRELKQQLSLQAVRTRTE